MISNGAKFRVGIGRLNLDDDDLEPQVVIYLYLPEVEKEIVYENIPLEDFDSPEAVLEYLEDIRGDSILLSCEFDDDGFEKRLEEVFNVYYGDYIEPEDEELI